MATTLKKENREYIPAAWETVPCPFCEGSDTRGHEKYGPGHRYTYVQCRHCELVYANPRPRYDAEFLEIAYSEYGTDCHHVRTGGALDAGERALVERYKITLRQLEGVLGRKGKILDIGCATGLFLLGAREEGWDTVGVDISAPMTAEATKLFGIPTYSGQYHDLDLSRHAPFDVIYSSHVIEHIPNPNEWMGKFRRELKPDGILCLNVPNQFSVDRLFKRGLKRLGLKHDNWELWRTPDHLYEPHLAPMRYLMERHSFQVVEAFTYSKREKEKVSLADRWMHRRLKAGSKLRLFARLTDAHSR